MYNIIKYEFLRKHRMFLITVVTAIIINLIAIINKGVTGSISFLSLFPVAISILYISDVIKMYSDDLNKKLGYMLFMTPNSGYKIVISKVLTAILEGFAILFIYLIFIIINGIYLMTVAGLDFNINLSEITKGINIILSGSIGFNLGHIFVFLLTALVFIMSFILTVYTSITIRKSIFSEIRLGGFLSFIIFIILNWGISYLSTKIMSALTPYYNPLINGTNVSATDLVTIFLPFIVLTLVECAIMTAGSGYLLEKKINL